MPHRFRYLYNKPLKKTNRIYTRLDSDKLYILLYTLVVAMLDKHYKVANCDVTLAKLSRLLFQNV